MLPGTLESLSKAMQRAAVTPAVITCSQQGMVVPMSHSPPGAKLAAAGVYRAGLHSAELLVPCTTAASTSCKQSSPTRIIHGEPWCGCAPPAWVLPGLCAGLSLQVF